MSQEEEEGKLGGIFTVSSSHLKSAASIREKDFLSMSMVTVWWVVQVVLSNWWEMEVEVEAEMESRGLGPSPQ